MLDINTWLEQVLKGIVFTIYNVLYSIAVIWRSPGRGPLLLWCRWRKPGVQQIGPHSLLLICSAVFALTIVGNVYRAALQTAAGAWESDDVRIWLWAFVGAAFFVTLDIAARLMNAMDGKPSGKRRKERSLALGLYAFSGLVAFFYMVHCIDENIIIYINNIDIFWSSEEYYRRWATWMACIVALFLIAILSRYGNVNLIIPKRFPSLIVGSLIVALLANIAVFSPGWRHAQNQSDMVLSYLRDNLIDDELTTSLSCAVDKQGGGATVDVVFTNDTAFPLAVDTTSFKVHLWEVSTAPGRAMLPFDAGTPPLLTASPKMEVSRYLIVPKGGTEQIALGYGRLIAGAKIRELLGKSARDSGIAAACRLEYKQLRKLFCDVTNEKCKLPVADEVAIGMAGLM